MKIRRTWFAFVATLLAAAVAQAQTDVLVSHYDDARTSANLSEPTLTVANVNSASFGKVYTFPVDGMVVAQPLFKSNLNFPGVGTFNVAFIATEHSSVYALDADTATPIWHRSFINPAAGLTTRTTVAGQEDILPEVSITSTPVIDPVTGTMYVVAETQQSGSPPYYWLHAIDITTGADKVAPVKIQASIGPTIPLLIDAKTSQQRPGLVLVNGVVYIGFGSSGDSYPWIGWLLGYDANTLAQVTVFCASSSGSQGAGIWSSGEAPPLDSNGNLFVATGNGYFVPTGGAWANSFLRMSTSGGLAVADSFSPYNQSALGNADLDLASAGMTLLPDSAGTAAHPHLMVASGKDGEVYVIDRDNMGGYQSAVPNTQIVQWLPYGASVGTPAVGVAPITVTNPTLPYVSNSYNSPAYWQNRVYFCGVKDACKLFTLSGGLLSALPASKTVATYAYPGTQPTVSAASSTATSAVLWAVERNSATLSILHAYNATNLATELYNSSQAAGGRDTAGAPVHFPKPTVANGRVFVPTASEVDVYGLLASNPPRLAAPVFTPASNGATGQLVTITAASGATIYYTLDGSLPTLNSTAYTGPLNITATTTVTAMAVRAGSLTSAASGTFPSKSVSYVQGNSATPQTSQTSVPVKFTAAQLQGDLNVVVVGWNDATVAVSTVADTQGNTYTRAGNPTVLAGAATQSIYYAANIAAAAAGANTVTVTFNGAATTPDVRVLEYGGMATASPFDVGAGATGNGPVVSSGTASTTNAYDLIVGANLTSGDTQGPGPGFTQRLLTVPDGDIVEDMTVSAANAYAATATLVAAAPTIMQMAAFRAASGTDAEKYPSAPSTLTATPTSAAAVSLAWGASSELGGSIAQYLVERCAGSACTSFAQVGTSTSTGFADTGLTGSTSYRYRVRAADSGGHAGPYSNAAAATTAPAIPTAPTNLAATAAGATQVNLSWGASSELGGGISQYLIERCQGAGCSTFIQVGTATGLSYADTGLTNATSYSYRVRAGDAAGQDGAYSNTATATTASASPSAPTSLAAVAVGTTQLNLSWAAASEAGGSISQYLIERCQGAGCNAFIQVGTATGLAYSDTGLATATSYSYRVRARDGTGTMGPYSNVASGLTVAPVFTAPTGVSATATSSQVSLRWKAATESGGTLSAYRIERCQGAGCTNFVAVASAAGLAFIDTPLAPSTPYRYRLRAADADGNVGPYSAVMQATTASSRHWWQTWVRPSGWGAFGRFLPLK